MDIYLDYAATSTKHFDIIEQNINKLKTMYANPNSSHTLGKKNANLLKEARQKIADEIGAKSTNIIFTSGGTESNNTVFNHVLENYTDGEIIISAIEHSSVKECAYRLEKKGFKIRQIEVNEAGSLNVEELEKNINNRTILVSVMFANNETGVLQPLEKISKLLEGKNILLHTDAVQAFAKTDIDVEKLNIDFLSASAHKIGGLNNFGFLYAKNTNVTPLILGGGQEGGLRSGTSDVLGALVFADVIDYTKKNLPKVMELKSYLLKKLTERGVSFEINGSEKNSLANIVNIYFNNIQAQRLITYLDTNNIYISGGAACGSGNIKGSKIITAMYDEKRAENSVRISLGSEVTEQMLDELVKKIVTLENKIKERNANG